MNVVATPAQRKLADALNVLKKLQDGGKTAIKSSDLTGWRKSCQNGSCTDVKVVCLRPGEHRR
jgi:hypothetical protein